MDTTSPQVYQYFIFSTKQISSSEILLSFNLPCSQAALSLSILFDKSEQNVKNKRLILKTNSLEIWKSRGHIKRNLKARWGKGCSRGDDISSVQPLFPLCHHIFSLYAVQGLDYNILYSKRKKISYREKSSLMSK